MGETNNVHIVFFKGVIETLDYFMEKLIQGAEDNNLDYYVANAGQEDTYSSPGFYEYIKQDNCILITFNQIGILLFDHYGNNVWEEYGVKIYDIVVDHPRNFAASLDDPLPVLNVLCIDRNHVRYINEFYTKVKNVAFLGHGGSSENSVNYRNRKYEVLYVGDCQQKISDFPVIDCFEDGGRELYSRVVSKILSDCNLTTEFATQLYLDESGFQYDKDIFNYIYSISSPHIENYVRRYYKQIGMRELDKLGITVDVYGNNWEDEEYQYGSNIRLHERVTSRECNYMAGDAKICLNFMPWFKEGTTERVFNAMLNKSVCVSDRSTVLVDIFTDGENIVFYDLDNPLQMAYDVKYLLEHPDVSEYIASNGYRVAKERCTWECRLLDIIDIHSSWYGNE